MTRESDFDDYTRSRISALQAWEAARCPNCGNYDCLVPLPKAARNVRWEEHGNRRAEVLQFRCIACGAADLIKRDFHERFKDEKPVSGQASPTDGRVFIARPLHD